MAYALFLLVNAALFIRPAEIVPDWQGLEIYFYLIVACALCGLPDVLDYLTRRPLETQPITLCVLGIMLLVPVPNLMALNFAEVWRCGFAYFKIVVYYLLFVSLVNTPARLRGYLSTLVPSCAGLALFTILRYHGVLELTNFAASVTTGVTTASGEILQLARLQGTGIFQDPNDLCMMLAATVPLALYLLLTDRSFLRKGLWIGCLLVFGYAIYLTRSRGGLLGLLAGLGVLAWARFGLQRALVAGALALPLLLAVFGGRQTTISAQETTAQTRIQLWSDWMTEFRAHPLFGNGMSLAREDEATKPRIPGQEYKHVAHNSYLQTFADIGFLGGCLFLGAYALALWSVFRTGHAGKRILDPGQQQQRPFVLAAVAGYSVGMLTLSLSFVVPTYLMLALAVAYSRVTVCAPPLPPLRLDERTFVRFLGLGIAYLAVMYVFIRLFINW